MTKKQSGCFWNTVYFQFVSTWPGFPKLLQLMLVVLEAIFLEMCNRLFTARPYASPVARLKGRSHRLQNGVLRTGVSHVQCERRHYILRES